MKYRVVALLPKKFWVMIMIKTILQETHLCSLLSVGESFVKLKRLGETKYLIAKLAKPLRAKGTYVAH
jgi:hypothetical protein